MNKDKKSLLEEVKKTKRHSKILWGIGILLFFVFLFFSGQWIRSLNQTSVDIEHTQTLQKNIKLSVEEDGEIKNPQDFNLAFLSSGRIENIFVKEGQIVKAGEKLAILDSQALDLEVQKAKANIQMIYAQISQQKAENTDLDFLQSEAELSSKESDIISTQQTTEQKVQESFDLSLIQIETSFYRLQNTIDTIDAIFGFNNQRIVSINGIFHDSIRYTQVKNDFETLNRKLKTQQKEWGALLENVEYADISRTLWTTQNLAKEFSALLESTIYLFANSMESQQVSLSSIQLYQAQLSQEKNQLYQEIQNLVIAKKNTENALMNQQTQIAASGNQLKQSIVKNESAEKITRQKEVSKEASISVSYAQLAQANAQLETALYNLRLATLIAPVDGEILNIEKEVGEIVNATQPFIKILSESNFIVEVYVEEMDIAKIKIGQSANVRIAALNDQVLEGLTSYISSNATEDENGVITYLVRLEIEKGQNTPIKEKMTASVEFIIDEVKDAIVVPVESVFQNQSGQSAVLLANSSEVIVETGLSDNTFVEIKKGLDQAGIQIIKYPLEGISLETDTVIPKLLPEIKKELETLGFSEKEIKKIELGEMDEALNAQLKNVQKEEKGGLSNMMKN